VIALKGGRIAHDGPVSGLGREALVDIYGPEFTDALESEK
jgi:phosphonate transport system ATP-binding protein